MGILFEKRFHSKKYLVINIRNDTLAEEVFYFSRINYASLKRLLSTLRYRYFNEEKSHVAYPLNGIITPGIRPTSLICFRAIYHCERLFRSLSVLPLQKNNAEIYMEICRSPYISCILVGDLWSEKNVPIQHMSSLQAWLTSIFIRHSICIVDLTGKSA